MKSDLVQLVADCQAAQAKMSKKNDHRAVLHRCELALMALLRERSEHSTAQEATDAPNHAA